MNEDVFISNLSRHIIHGGNISMVATIIEISPDDNSKPMLAVPYCGEMTGLARLNSVVNVLTTIQRVAPTIDILVGMFSSSNCFFHTLHTPSCTWTKVLALTPKDLSLTSSFYSIRGSWLEAQPSFSWYSIG
jgi:hypothetical protein